MLILRLSNLYAAGAWLSTVESNKLNLAAIKINVGNKYGFKLHYRAKGYMDWLCSNVQNFWWQRMSIVKILNFRSCLHATIFHSFVTLVWESQDQSGAGTYMIQYAIVHHDIIWLDTIIGILQRRDFDPLGLLWSSKVQLQPCFVRASV